MCMDFATGIIHKKWSILQMSPSCSTRLKGFDAALPEKGMGNVGDFSLLPSSGKIFPENRPKRNEEVTGLIQSTVMHNLAHVQLHSHPNESLPSLN
jgi:hypothetical protein